MILVNNKKINKAKRGEYPLKPWYQSTISHLLPQNVSSLRKAFFEGPIFHSGPRPADRSVLSPSNTLEKISPF